MAHHEFDATVLKIREKVGGIRPRRLEVPGFRRAAVLIPILRRPEGATILFTQRTETVHDHKGQISFPGGRTEGSESAEETALREAMEEVALSPSRVEVVGTLDDNPSVSNYVVRPVVGVIADPPDAFVRQETEVLEPFEVPLASLLDRSRFRFEWWDPTMMPPGAQVEKLLELRDEFDEIDRATGKWQVYFFDGGGGRVIWGLTARILKQFLDLTFAFSS